jgi:hypothetical protein
VQLISTARLKAKKASFFILVLLFIVWVVGVPDKYTLPGSEIFPAFGIFLTALVPSFSKEGI